MSDQKNTTDSPSPLEEQPAFAELQGLLAQPRSDLKWHHAVGCCLDQLCRRGEDSKHAPYGEKQFNKLAAVLGRSPSPLRKQLRFAREFVPTEVEELEQMKLGWTLITHAFSEPDRAKRWALLEKATTEGWNSEDLKKQIKARGKSRHPRGGRPPRRSRNGGAVADLAKLLGHTQTWLNFHQHVLAANDGSPRAWLQRLLASKRDEGVDTMLREVREALEQVAEAATGFNAPLAEMHTEFSKTQCA